VKNFDSRLKAKFHREVQRKGLSIDLLRKYEGLENLSDDDARQAIRSIEKLTEFLFNFLKNQEIKSL
jgi:hypothetical protein